MKYIALSILCMVLINRDEQYNLIRKTKYGLIRGELRRSAVDPTIEYYSFRGVPYARPPIGNLRFQEPQPPNEWSGIREVNVSGPWCAQLNDWFPGPDVLGSEDCLYLEIHVPKTLKPSGQQLMPVIAWIHGGTFVFGSATSDDPDYLMEQPAVIVSIGYRLNVFSFLSTKDAYAKGNNGLKDQRLALKWIQDNIENFGGDPNSVTIFGCSAGGASVQYHMLSPGSKGLFHKAISQSGSTLNRWAFQSEPLKMTWNLAKGLGIETTDSRKLIKELQKIDYKLLLRTAFNQSVVGFYLPYYEQPFAPSVESESDTAVISESTFNLMAQGKFASPVPYITGYTSEEGSFGYFYVDNGKVDINIYESDPGLLIPISMNVVKDSNCYNTTIRKIKAHYFKNQSVTDKANWIKYMNQELFVRGITKFLELAHEIVPVYQYRFSYVGSHLYAFIGGAGHYDDVWYIWKSENPILFRNISVSDRLTSKRLIKLWTKFAATGNPTPETDQLLQNVVWPKYDQNKHFLDINNDLTVLKNSDPDDVFWKKLFQECGNPPYYTY